jgi:hypothetical protein
MLLLLLIVGTMGFFAWPRGVRCVVDGTPAHTLQVLSGQHGRSPPERSSDATVLAATTIDVVFTNANFMGV